jgi:hypothetical protein
MGAVQLIEYFQSGPAMTNCGSPLGLKAPRQKFTAMAQAFAIYAVADSGG